MADAKFCRMCQRMLTDGQQVYCSSSCQSHALRKLEDDPALSMDSRCRRAWLRTDVLHELPMAAQLFLAERAQQQRPSYATWKALTPLRCRCTGSPRYPERYEHWDDEEEMECVQRSVLLGGAEIVRKVAQAVVR